MSATRVLVCSPIRLYGEGLAAVLGTRDDLHVTGCAMSPSDCLRLADRQRPQMVVVDTATIDAVPLVSALVQRRPEVQVVALGLPEVEAAVVACAEAGAAACVTREESLEELVATLSHVARGDSLCTPRTAGVLLRRIRTLAARVPKLADERGLTRRELEVIELLDEGLSNQEIAFRLCIELSTVKNHVHSILGKLGVKRRSQAAAVYRRRVGYGSRHTQRSGAWAGPKMHPSGPGGIVGRS